MRRILLPNRNIFQEEHKSKMEQLSQLPVSCWDSANQLEKQMDIYTKYGVFGKENLEGTMKLLRIYKDENIREKVKDSEAEMMKLVEKFMHCG